jgi:formylglycine-generating enzyme required for sulfatase activity
MGSGRVMRGGRRLDRTLNYRSAFRTAEAANFYGSSIGFRVLLDSGQP